MSRSLFAANGLDDRANHRADHSRTTINRMTVTPLIDERRSEAGAIDEVIHTIAASIKSLFEERKDQGCYLSPFVLGSSSVTGGLI